MSRARLSLEAIKYAAKGGCDGSSVMAFLGRLRSWWNKDAVGLAEEETRMTQAERDSAEQDYRA